MERYYSMKIPTILCGPIIRRVEPSQVYIWIALSEPLNVGAKLYKTIHSSQNDSYRYELLTDKSMTKTVQLGNRLYIHLIKIIPHKEHFPTNTLLGYNLFFNTGDNVLNLGDFQLLSHDNPNSIVYGNLDLPTFYISSGAKSNILYGSCRKLHGKGEDVLASADITLQESFLQLDKRPSTLFLLGDQIYADDVADPLVPLLSSIRREIIGQEEGLERVEPGLNEDFDKDRINRIHGRKFIMDHFCKFTSLHSDNHLIQFSEYAAMYLLSWSPELWFAMFEQQIYEPFEEALRKDQFHFIYPDQDRYHSMREKELQKHNSRYSEQHDDIIRFQHSLPRIRRLLANTPTYMMFDDHDITDDWNITDNWKSNVWNAPLGRHVITNGLAAYWAFQGWGNDPENFNDRFIKTISNYLSTLNVNSHAYIKYVEQLWSFDNWYFIAPTEPKTVFLDTRTMRGYKPLPMPKKIGTIIEEHTQGPELIHENGWSMLTETLEKSGWKAGTPLIIASPSPLYGIELIESFFHNYIQPLHLVGIPVRHTFDLEGWHFNGKGFTRFLEMISQWNPSHCFILSGDVHYTYSAMADIEFQNNRKTALYQFTSSPMNNMSFTGILGSLMKTMIWLNSINRKNVNMKRFCDQEFNIVEEAKHSSCPASFVWKETIKYFEMDNGSIIETENNVGLLSISANKIQNSLLTTDDFLLKKMEFNEITLND